MGDTLPMLRSVLKSQYHASLAMLREAIQRCPPEEWLSTDHKNAFWQLSYHALFFAHLYLQHDEAAFRLWEKHRGEADGISGEPYTQAQVLEYWEFCDRMVDDAVDSLDLDRTESGFSWYQMSKLEHQLVNIRHGGYPLDSGDPNRLWFGLRRFRLDDAVVGNRIDRHCLLGKSEEE